eukprot:TRINITY_DN19684_c1_g1_i1.p1 TRINITY_DN19684_c1_g1~~TRINITY_DN19684_c1_g1_i1.p1  ORF type:complete len:504 (+),score=203.26 TRINITY_DN19684_c1_g1_i1:78-1514(+)
MASALLSAALLAASGAVPADLVTSLPGFASFPFEVYSGYLTVQGPFEQNPYDKLKIHYELHTSQRSPKEDPLVTWHQGGPGGNSLYGAYAEGGYFQSSERGTWVNPNSWNRVANMLYLESPAGSTDPIGSSVCYLQGEAQKVCSWNDTSQAEAYSHSLKAFFASFPEYAQSDLYFTGESYAGQYVPNIAYWMLTEMPGRFNLKGIAVGNGCWGGTEHSVQCNGPNEERMDAELFYGKGLVSKKLYDATAKSCGWDGGNRDVKACQADLKAVDDAVGPHNVYDVYDNCDSMTQWSARANRSAGWLRRWLRGNMHRGQAALSEAAAMGGGYDWACGGMAGFQRYFQRADVRKALHLGAPGSTLAYNTSGPASMLLYPTLVKHIRVLIFNGDADSCVPYIGNEEWTTALAATGAITETAAWHPWYVNNSMIPAGYATNYNVTGASTDFAFVTVRLGGHMVPTFRPVAAFELFSRFLARRPF